MSSVGDDGSAPAAEDLPDPAELPGDDAAAPGEVVGEDPGTTSPSPSSVESEAEAAVRQLQASIDAAAVEADVLGQTAEDAVVEAVDLAQRMEAERDELRDLVQRVKADFDNYKRRVEAQRTEQRATAALGLVEELLPVLDACDAAILAGHDDVDPIQGQLLLTLGRLGLVKVAEIDVAFDPNVHEAVLHEEGEGEPTVAEVMRAGYMWNAHVVRPAMVKVKG